MYYHNMLVTQQQLSVMCEICCVYPTAPMLPILYES